MAADLQAAGTCPRCGKDALVCRYNFFDRGDLQVHSWEHKCTNCGGRETKAFRSDDPAGQAALEGATTCPFCSRPAPPAA